MTIPTRFEPLSCSSKRLRETMKMPSLKEILSRVSSHDLQWENKSEKRKKVYCNGNESVISYFQIF